MLRSLPSTLMQRMVVAFMPMDEFVMGTYFISFMRLLVFRWQLSRSF